LSHIEGTLQDRRCTVHCQNQVAQGGHNREPETLPSSDQSNVLNLLHPLNRMPGLYPGQHWHMPLVDLLAAVIDDHAPLLRRVEAQVHEGTLERERHPVACWIVTYHAEEGIVGRTWVRVSDALVLRQEMRVSV